MKERAEWREKNEARVLKKMGSSLKSLFSRKRFGKKGKNSAKLTPGKSTKSGKDKNGLETGTEMSSLSSLEESRSNGKDSSKLGLLKGLKGQIENR